MRKKRRKHFHTIGQYWHSSSELINFSYGSHCDGLGNVAQYYAYCPDCGKEITKEIIKDYMRR